MTIGKVARHHPVVGHPLIYWADPLIQCYTRLSLRWRPVCSRQRSADPSTDPSSLRPCAFRVRMFDHREGCPAPPGGGTPAHLLIRPAHPTLHSIIVTLVARRGPAGSTVSNHVTAPRSAPSLTRASETHCTTNLDYKVLFDTTTSNSSTFYKEFTHTQASPSACAGRVHMLVWRCGHGASTAAFGSARPGMWPTQHISAPQRAVTPPRPAPLSLPPPPRPSAVALALGALGGW